VGTGHWLAQLVLFALLVAILVLGAIALIRYLRANPSALSTRSPETPSTPEDVLRMRLARGEIDAEEFRSTMSALTGT
jgi:uncharacterized membrane protein